MITLYDEFDIKIQMQNFFRAHQGFDFFENEGGDRFRSDFAENGAADQDIADYIVLDGDVLISHGREQVQSFSYRDMADGGMQAQYEAIINRGKHELGNACVQTMLATFLLYVFSLFSLIY